MGIRAKIANWLAPELAEYATFWEQANENNIVWRHRVQAECGILKELMVDYRVALRKISEQRTANANATVKRMASIAETALNHPHSPAPLSKDKEQSA